MDATPPPYSDMPEPPERLPSANPSVNEDRRRELLLDALKVAIVTPGEHRLFRSGKLPGLFPTRAGLAAEAALMALQNGLLETARTEVKGKIIVEWVRVTPEGVAFVHDHDSPKSVLRELKELLQTTRAGVPAWMDEAQRELEQLSTRFHERANAILQRLDDLTVRVDAALRRAETSPPGVAEPVGKVVPWAVEALGYLDRRMVAGALSDCPLPELFHAVRGWFPELTLPAFHDGIRRLYDVRAVRLSTAMGMAEPEYAVVVEGKLMYAIGR